MLTLPFFLGCNNKTDTLIAKDATLQVLSDGYTFTEGPAVAPDGDVFFTDQPNNQILKWNANTGETSIFMKPAGRSNGLYFDNEKRLLAAADENYELWRINKDKTVTVLLDAYQNAKLNGPNDLWVDPKGGIYFTDPYYQRPYWERQEKEQEKERVYYLAPNGADLTPVANDLVRPNGIIGDPSGKTLYVADIGGEKTYAYSIESNGMLSNKRLFAPLGSDGMTLDNRGNLYLTGNGVTIFDSNGEQVQHIPVPATWTANVTFGGPGEKLLFITAMDKVYTLKMNANGVRWH